MEYAQMVLVQLATRSPVLLVELAAVVIAVATWRRHPPVSALVAVGAAVMFLLGLASVGVSLMPVWLRQRDLMTTAEIGRYMGAYGLVSSLLHACALAAVLVAAFGFRTKPAA